MKLATQNYLFALKFTHHVYQQFSQEFKAKQSELEPANSYYDPALEVIIKHHFEQGTFGISPKIIKDFLEAVERYRYKNLPEHFEAWLAGYLQGYSQVFCAQSMSNNQIKIFAAFCDSFKNFVLFENYIEAEAEAYALSSPKIRSTFSIAEYFINLARDKPTKADGLTVISLAENCRIQGQESQFPRHPEEPLAESLKNHLHNLAASKKPDLQYLDILMSLRNLTAKFTHDLSIPIRALEKKRQEDFFDASEAISIANTFIFEQKKIFQENITLLQELSSRKAWQKLDYLTNEQINLYIDNIPLIMSTYVLLDIVANALLDYAKRILSEPRLCPEMNDAATNSSRQLIIARTLQQIFTDLNINDSTLKNLDINREFREKCSEWLKNNLSRTIIDEIYQQPVRNFFPEDTLSPTIMQNKDIAKFLIPKKFARSRSNSLPASPSPNAMTLFAHYRPKQTNSKASANLALTPLNIHPSPK